MIVTMMLSTLLVVDWRSEEEDGSGIGFNNIVFSLESDNLWYLRTIMIAEASAPSLKLRQNNDPNSNCQKVRTRHTDIAPFAVCWIWIYQVWLEV